jgi:2-oxoglutarate dehydrogenase complex dehydrogenase (E1) component-like enzyme
LSLTVLSFATFAYACCSVHKSWDVYFRQVESGSVPGEAFIPPPTIQQGVTPVRSVGGAVSTDHNDALGLSYLIRAYQVRGHEAANLDPLGLQERPALPELDITMYGFTEKDLDRVIAIPKNLCVFISLCVFVSCLPLYTVYTRCAPRF